MVIDSDDALDVDVEVVAEVEGDVVEKAEMSMDEERQARRGMTAPIDFGIRILDKKKCLLLGLMTPKKSLAKITVNKSINSF